MSSRKHRYKRYDCQRKKDVIELFTSGVAPVTISKITGISEGRVSTLLTNELNTKILFHKIKREIHLNTSDKEQYWTTEEEIEKSLSLEYKPEDLTGDELAIYRNETNG